MNILLLGLFAAQHSVMARPAFKRWWSRIVPPPIERSTFVLFASLALLLLYWQWRPMPTPVWTVESQVGIGILHSIFWFGWALLLISAGASHDGSPMTATNWELPRAWARAACYGLDAWLTFQNKVATM